MYSVAGFSIRTSALSSFLSFCSPSLIFARALVLGIFAPLAYCRSKEAFMPIYFANAETFIG